MFQYPKSIRIFIFIFADRYWELSPEPPKLSSPIDYEKAKSPDAIRDSPPVLSKIYIAI